MRIAFSDFAFQVTHSATSSQTTQTRLSAWVGRDPAASAPRPVPATASAPTLSTALPSSATNSVQSSMDEIERDPKLVMIRAFVEMMTGQSVRFVSAADLGIDNAPSTPAISPEATAAPDAPSPTTSPTTPPIATTPAGFGIEFDSRTVVQETEQTDFQADAIVRTADGQTISLSLSLHMSRSYRSETTVSLRQGDAVKKDPLVINFGGKAAQLQSQRFKFDLNGDGTPDNVPLFSNDKNGESSSGYLAIDLNHNGRIDSGRELFGPGTGNGFAELSRYDQDGNGWIDEGDAVFKQLKVWTPAATGNGTMNSLQARGVGALHLGYSATPFELRDSNNRSLGSVRSTGAYLMENGGAGTLQQIDLTV